MTRIAPWLALALVLAAALLVHGGALRAPFFADDFLFLDLVRHRSLPDALAAPDPLGNFLRPVGRAAHFWWASRVGGEQPWPFHATNLALALLSIALLFDVARRLAGPRAAVFAAAAFALHHAFDVPVRWASGSQDLIALAGALGAIALHLRGRTIVAAASLLVGLLAKESVALTAVVAIVAARGPGEPWRHAVRRGLPLLAATLLWAIAWIAALARGRVTSTGLTPDPTALAAAFANLLRTAFGVEWRGDGAWPAWTLAALPAMALAIAALVWTWRAEPEPPRGARRARLTGAVWAVAGALPVVMVAPIWSGYYYLFAMAGVALLLGAWAARWRWPEAAALLALVLVGSQHARALDEFATAPGAWTAQSHVNRFYLERAMHESQGYLADLRRARPTLPPRSTVFLYALPSFVAFQAADGPLLRWAYRDTSLRSYYTAELTRARAERGPWFLFEAQPQGLVEIEATPGFLLDLATGQMLSDRIDVAREINGLAMERDTTSDLAVYLDGWLALAQADTAAFIARMNQLGFGLSPRRPPGMERAFERLEAGDTTGALAIVQRGVMGHVLDPGVHALMSDLLRMQDPRSTTAAIEAHASLRSSPETPLWWLRWAGMQATHGRTPQALASLARYRQLGGAGPEYDPAAETLQRSLEARMPGSAAAQADLRLRRRDVSAP